VSRVALPQAGLAGPLEENACWALLERYRWPDGPVCPDCEHVRAVRPWLGRLHRWRCAACGCRFHAAQGTAIESTHLPLVAWFAAIHLLAEVPGLSSARLSRALGLRQKTAWSLTQRARRLAAEDPLLHRVIVKVARYGTTGAMPPGTAQAKAVPGAASDRTYIHQHCTVPRLNPRREPARKRPGPMHESA
jgi:transposase-like protein